MAIARIDGIDLHYRITGAEDSPPLLLLHGYSASGRMWGFQRQVFAERYRVITVDLRGHGQTGGRRGLSLVRFAQDIHALFDHLELRAAHVVGLSMGGMTAIEFALQHPDRVQSLTLCDTLAGQLPLPFRAVFTALPFAPGPALGRYMSYRARDVRSLTPELEEVIACARHADPGAVLLAGRALACKRNRERAVERFRFPTLVLVGDRDVLFNGAMVLYERIPNASLAVLERCQHGSALFRPRTFNHALSSFLSGVRDGTLVPFALRYPETRNGEAARAEPLSETPRAAPYWRDSCDAALALPGAARTLPHLLRRVVEAAQRE